MKIAVQLAFDEEAAVRLLNWLAEENALILRAHPTLPGLYQSGVRYERETEETWCDYLNLLMQGHEDCDGLSAARAGELLARGWQALSPEDGGYATARARGLSSIPAQVYLRTRADTCDPRTRRCQPGLYHCLVRYFVGGRWYVDDPSARLGMYGPEASWSLPEPNPDWPPPKRTVSAPWARLSAPTSSTSQRRSA